MGTEIDNMRLRNLINSLQGISQKSPNEHFKVRDDYEKDYKGEIHLVTARKAYVLPLLQQQFRSNIERRGMVYKEYCGMPENNPLLLAEKYLTDPTTRTCMLLYGTTGTGKTTLMKAMYDTMRVLYENHAFVKLWFVKASELGNVMKTNEQQFKSIRDCTMLFIDDLACGGEAEVISDYGVKRYPIETLIETRYDRQLATICTTNLTFQELKERYGSRIHSRMMEMFMALPMCGEDYRMTASKQYTI